MPRKLLRALAVGLLLAARLRAEDDPRALVARAVRVQGIPAEGMPSASLMKVKGRLLMVEGATFTAEAIQQWPHQFRQVLDVDLGGTRVRSTVVRNGLRAWRSTNGQTEAMNAKEMKGVERSDRVDQVTGLVALLRDRAYTLTALGETIVEGRPAAGVKVTARDMPDVHLYFDKVSGLLVKSAYRDTDAIDENHEVRQETFYFDYKPVKYAAADEAMLRAAKRDVDGPALLELFRSQTLKAADRDAMKALARQLGDRSFRRREQAADRLVQYGASALPVVRQAARSTDPEVARRAGECLRQIDADSGDALLAAAARLLALHQPAGTAEVLLAYLPDATGDPVAREVQAALAAVARRDGKPNPALVQALDDPEPARRAAAASALGRDGGAYERRPGRRVYVPGLQQATRVRCHREGEKFLEWEVTDFQLFNGFDENVFVKP